MKIRTGFVSNSSSSSFLIYGVALGDLDEAKEDLGISDFGTLVDNAEKLGITAEMDPEGSVWVGMSWSNVKDDETGLQFKQRVNRLITELLGREYKCDTYQEAWFD